MGVQQRKQSVGPKFVDLWEGGLRLGPEQIQGLSAILDDGEQQKAETFKFPAMRDRFIAVRGLLRQTLAHYLDVAPASLQFETGAYGKPHLVCDSVYFNLSHCADKLIIAVADFPDIGVDIEAIKPRSSLGGLARRCFSDRELSKWRQLAPDRQLLDFYRLWTKKEAFVKAVGRGIALGMELCEFELEQGGQVLAIPDEYGLASAWRVTELPVSADFSAALVTRRCRFELRRREIVIASSG